MNDLLQFKYLYFYSCLSTRFTVFKLSLKILKNNSVKLDILRLTSAVNSIDVSELMYYPSLEIKLNPELFVKILRFLELKFLLWLLTLENKVVLYFLFIS